MKRLAELAVLWLLGHPCQIQVPASCFGSTWVPKGRTLVKPGTRFSKVPQRFRKLKAVLSKISNLMTELFFFTFS